MSKNYEITVNDTLYEVFSTTTDTTHGLFRVEFGIKGNDDSHLKIDFALFFIESELREAGECDGVSNQCSSDGDHVTVDYEVEPDEVWANKSEHEKIEFVEDDIIKYIKTLYK